jgi:HAD superfamily hydrolase (TIGR01509 family)
MISPVLPVNDKVSTRCHVTSKMTPMRALIFDLDGTLIDTVYAHVIAWQKSFAADDIVVPAWKLHQKIGLGGKRLAITIAREMGKTVSADQADSLDQRHGAVMKELMPHAMPLDGARELLRHLHQLEIPFGIATSGERSGVKEPLQQLGLPDDAIVISKSDVKYAKPEPDLFLACRERLDVPPEQCFVVGDATWDMLAAQRSGMLGIGVLTGGVSRSELTQAGAYRVYQDPAELDEHLYELGWIGDED